MRRNTRLTALVTVGLISVIGAAVLYSRSLRWVADAEARVKAAQSLGLKDQPLADSLPAAATSGQQVLSPSDPNSQLSRAKELAESGKFVSALVPAERAVNLDPKNPQAHLLLAMICSTAGYGDDAVKHFRTAISLDPQLLEAYQRLGDLYQAMGNTNAAEETFREALAKAGDKPGPRLSLAQIYYSRQRTSKLLEILQPLLDQPEPPVAALYLAGKVYQSTNRSRQSEEVLRKAIAQRKDFAEAYHALGSLLANEGRYDEGIPLLKTAANLDTSNATYYYALGNALRADRSRPSNITDARTAFEQAIDIDPGMPIAHYFYGLTLEETGELQAALREFRRTLELDPKFLSAGYRTGIVYRELGNTAEAQKYMLKFGAAAKQEISQVHGGRRADSFVDTAESHYKRAMAFLNRGQRDEAIAALKTALDRDASHGLARRQLRSLGVSLP